MKYRDPSSGGDLFAFIDHQKKRSESRTGVAKLSEIIDWEGFRSELEDILGYAKRAANTGGRPPFDPVLMFKILVLQKYYGLSDAAVEEQVSDRFSFLAFLGLHSGDAVPDGNTVWDFREALEQDKRDGTARLFAQFDQMLNGKGLIGREGSLIDASFVEAPKQRNTREQNAKIKEEKRPEEFGKETARGRQKDCDARWTKKNNETHYGYKNHAKVDAKSKLVTKYTTSEASLHDSQKFKELVDESDQAVFARQRLPVRRERALRARRLR